MEHYTWEESGLQKYPRVAYQAKPNEAIVFDKPFMVEGEKYNAISQNNDGALLVFDYEAPGKEEK